MFDKPTHEFFMARCLQLASNGLGNTYPNPFVGSIIVHQNKIIGEGYTSQYGGPHAEVNAIENVKDKSLLSDSTLYVTLEPCAHFGKTPPCCDLIITKKIPRVVVGCVDPFAQVNGEGIRRMREQGVEVIVGVLQEECLTLNKRFFTFHQKKRPYIILKWAETFNGYFAPVQHEQKWITNVYSKQLVHWWRTQEEAILIGTKTAIIDNPQLNARLVNAQYPIRLVIDRSLEIPTTHHLYDTNFRTIIFNEIKSAELGNISFVRLDFEQEIIPSILETLYQENITSVIVEGGVKTLNSFIKQNLWDEARIFRSAIRWQDGIKSPEIKGKIILEKTILNDHLTVIRNER